MVGMDGLAHRRKKNSRRAACSTREKDFFRILDAYLFLILKIFFTIWKAMRTYFPLGRYGRLGSPIQRKKSRRAACSTQKYNISKKINNF